MLNIAIIILIIVGLIIHRHLTMYWELGCLPYSFGFLVFANIFAFLYLVNFIWMFGLLAGVVIAALTFFQIPHTAALWVFLVPSLLMMQKKRTIPRVNRIIYGGWSYIVMLLGALTIVNLFVSGYKAVWEYFGHNYKMFILIFLVVVVVGNLLRTFVMSKFLKAIEHL